MYINTKMTVWENNLMTAFGLKMAVRKLQKVIKNYFGFQK